MQDLYINTIMLFIFMFILTVFYIKLKNCKITSKNLSMIINKNEVLIDRIYKNCEVIKLKNNIELFSNIQIISKISKANYISFFKYNYSKKYVSLDFIFSVDDKGMVVKNSILDEIPVSDGLLSMDIMRHNKNLDYIDIDTIKNRNTSIFNILLTKGINKIYYQNIFKNDNLPFVFVVFSYNTYDYIIERIDRIEICRILEESKSLF